MLKKYDLFLESCSKGNKNSKRSRAEDLRRTAEAPWFVQPRTGEAEGRSHGGLQLLMRDAEGSNSAQGNGMELPSGEGQMKVRERLFTEGVVGYWNSIPRKVVIAPS